jgi:hypothetical protein
MSRALLLLATLLLGACAPAPAPEILSVTPGLIFADEPARLTISLDSAIPVHVDYAREQASQATAQVRIGDAEALLEELQADGTLVVTAPAGLASGKYDVRVSLSDGREAVSLQALTVVELRSGPVDPDGDGGEPIEQLPDGGIVVGDGEAGVTGFRFDPIAELQQSGGSFEVRIEALGPSARAFQDVVTLSPSKKNVSVSPTTLQFTDGMFTGTVTVTGRVGNLKLTVRSGDYARGTSNGFRVQ